MPYMEPAERLLLSLVNKTQEDWYYSFLENPATYCVEKKVKTVIMMHENNDDNDDNDDFTPPRNPEERFNPENPIDIAKLGNIEKDKILTKHILKNENVSAKLMEFIGAKRLFIKTHGGYLPVMGV